MAAINYDFTVEAGAGFTVDFVQTDASATVIPFTAGSTAEFQARITPRATGSPLLTVTPTLDAVNGKVTLHLSDTQTRSLDLPTVDAVVYAIEVHPPTGDTIRLVQGVITCSPEVVRP